MVLIKLHNHIKITVQTNELLIAVHTNCLKAFDIIFLFFFKNMDMLEFI